MLPSKGSFLALLFLACLITVNCLPFNAKYRFVRDAEGQDDGSGNEGDSSSDKNNNGTVSDPPVGLGKPQDDGNSTSPEQQKDEADPAEQQKDEADPAEQPTEDSKNGESNVDANDQKDEAEKNKAKPDNQPQDDRKDDSLSLADDQKKTDEQPEDSDTKSNIEENEEDNTDEGSEDLEMSADDNDMKMFFISPFEKNEEEASARQILTYPAKSQGWGHTHQFGPSHIWNSDYPYFAYGYSWGCGHHGYGPHGYAKKSKVKGGKTEEKNTEEKGKICRDYVLIPAVAPAPAVLAPNENGVTRDFVSKDIACNDGDTDCAQRQVIGSMAGGSMFGDGMGGLGLGFPGVPGIHTGISGYNMAGGFGDHTSCCGGRGGHGGHAGHGAHAGYGGFGGFGGASHFFKADEHGFPSFWNTRGDIPKNDEITRNFFGHGVGDGHYGPGVGAAFFHGEDILPIHEASAGVGSGHSYSIGSAQWWDKTPSFHGIGFGNGDVVAGDFGGHGVIGGHPFADHGDDAVLGGPVNAGWGVDGHGVLADGHGFGGYGFGGYGYGGHSVFGATAFGDGLHGGYGGNGYGYGGYGLNGYAGHGYAGHGYGYGDGYNGLGAHVPDGIVDGDLVDGHGVGVVGHNFVGGHPFASHGVGVASGWAFDGHGDGFAGHYGLDPHHGITFNAVHGHGLHALKSDIKHSKKSKTIKATTRQDIAMPDEQAMMDVTKQRQLIGSLGASTLFSDNVGGMGEGHPGVPQMSSGIAGIPGEYGGSGGYAHGWDGEGPGAHPHGYNNFGYNGGDNEFHERRGETPAPEMVDENAEKRQIIGGVETVDPSYSQNAVQYANGDHGAMALQGFPGHGTTQVTSVHHHRISHDDEGDDGYVPGPVAGGYVGNGYVGNGYAANGYVGNGYVGNGYVAGVPVGRYGGPIVAGRPYHPRHVHVGVGTPGVKVEVETAKSVISSKPVHVTGQKMSEIKNIVKDVSESLAKTNKKLKNLKAGGEKRQITPAFTPVVSEPVGVPSNRYPVPAADRYPLGAGYIWPSANYGHQYGGPYSWSKSHTPKASKASKAKSSKRHHKSKRSGEKHKRSVDEKVHHQKPKKDDGRKRQFIHHGYGDMPNYGMGESMPYPRSIAFGPTAGGVLGHHFDGGYGGFDGGLHGDYHYGGHLGFGHHGYGSLHGAYGAGYGDYGHGGYYGHAGFGHGDFGRVGYGHDAFGIAGFGHGDVLGVGHGDGFGAFDAGHHEYGVEGGIDLHGGLDGHYGGHYGGLGFGHGLGYGHAGFVDGGLHHGAFYGGHGGIVGDYDSAHGGLDLDTHGFGGHPIDGPLGPLGGHSLRFSHGGGLEQGLVSGAYGHGAYGHGVLDGGFAHGAYDGAYAGHGLVGHGLVGGYGNGLIGGYGHGDGYAREHIEQEEQFMAPSSRSITPEPMYNEQESSSMFEPQQSYEMEREYAGAKKSKVPK